MWRALQVLSVALSLPVVVGALDLKGTISPKPARALVHLRSIEGLTERTIRADRNGSFGFKGLQRGTYVLAILVLNEGEMRKTVEISERLADAAGVVHLPVEFSLAKEDRSYVHFVRAHAFTPLWALQVPNEARRKYKEGIRSLRSGDKARAIANLEQAAMIAPKFTGVRIALGRIAFDAGDYRSAEAQFRQVLEQDPHDLIAAINLGGVLLNEKRCTEALPLNLRAVEQLPADATTSSQLGLTYLCLGDLVTAATHLSAARNIDPDHYSKPQLALAMIYLDRGSLALAELEIKDALRRHPSDALGVQLKNRLESARAGKANR